MCYFSVFFKFLCDYKNIFKEVSEMKDFRLHLIVLILIVVAEKIGNISITVGVGKIVLLPMMYALLMGVATAPRFTKISSEKNV